MFLINSRLGLFTAALLGVNPKEHPLLPKLRGHFAEFLNESSLAHLENSHLDYLCRFAVRAPIFYLEAFLGSVKSTTRRHNVFSPSQLSLNEYRICLILSLTA